MMSHVHANRERNARRARHGIQMGVKIVDKASILSAWVFLVLSLIGPLQTRAGEFDAPNRFLRDGVIRYGDAHFDPKTNLVWRADKGRLDVCQHSLEYAAALLAAGQQRERANAVVSAVLDHQDVDPDSPTFGNFLWWHGETRVRDRNAVCFMSPWLAHLAIEHGEKLSAENARRLPEALRRSIHGVRAHKSGPDYTNIWLLKAASMVMLGRALGEEELERDGADRIGRWIQYTAENGISEYNSPCYNAVDVYALEWIYHYATDATLRRQVSRCLNYLYADVFQQWHWEAGIGAGTHSRAYDRDRDTGRSLVSCLVFKQCAQPLRERMRSFLYVFAVNDYPVPPRIRAAARKERMYPFRMRYRILQGPRAVECSLYMTRQFSLGTQSGRRSIGDNRPFWDLPFKITYAGSNTERRSSYITPIPTTAHTKIASLQHGPAAIVLYEADLANSKLDTAVMRLNIEPAAGGMVDEMLVGGQAYDGRPVSLSPGTLIGWRVGRTLVAMRLLEARTTASIGTAPRSSAPYRLGPVSGAGLCLDGLLTPQPASAGNGNNLNCGFVVACATARHDTTLADFLQTIRAWTVKEKVTSTERAVDWRTADARLEWTWDSAANRVVAESIHGTPVDRRLRYDSPLIRLADGQLPDALP